MSSTFTLLKQFACMSDLWQVRERLAAQFSHRWLSSAFPLHRLTSSAYRIFTSEAGVQSAVPECSAFPQRSYRRIPLHSHTTCPLVHADHPAPPAIPSG